MKQRNIELNSLLGWLKSLSYLTIYTSGSLCEIPIPSQKRLVGNIDGQTLTINTVLLSEYSSRLEPLKMKKRNINISKNITVAEVEKEK
jgi:hypothetical protein